MKKILFLIFLLFHPLSANTAEKNLINKLYYSGFSFSGDFKDKNKYLTNVIYRFK